MLSTLSILRKGSVEELGQARAFLDSFILPYGIDAEERTRMEHALAGLFGN